jgi:hypothetical protein
MKGETPCVKVKIGDYFTLHKLGRRLRARPVGRPKGAKTRKPAKKSARLGSPVRK